MIADKTYKEKFLTISPWGADMIHAVRKEIKTEHLPRERGLVQKYFTKKAIDKLSPEELSDAYLQEISEGNEDLAAWICSRWMLRYGEIYHFFAERLQEINPDFEQIEMIPDAQGVRWMEEAIDAFGAKLSYVFCVINAVSFSSELFLEFRQRVEAEEEKLRADLPDEKFEDDVEGLKRRHVQEIVRLTERYEKKLLGFQKKYSTDVDALKKQIAALQRRLG